jgi:hypothetical protein
MALYGAVLRSDVVYGTLRTGTRQFSEQARCRISCLIGEQERNIQ